jgi:S1-C subfamily serine protease
VVVKVDSDSGAERGGFREGDIIRQVNGNTVANTAEFTKLIGQLKGERPVRFLVERGEIRIILALSFN